MEIEILKTLRDNPVEYGKTRNFTNRGITIDEIIQLEQKYNNGKFFPKALRELLFLAGDFCYFLEYGASNSQEKLQQFVRRLMLDDNIQIDRPFFAIDVYNAYDNCLIVYLDEGDNPNVYEVHYEEGNVAGYIGSLKWYTETLIKRVKNGANPF